MDSIISFITDLSPALVFGVIFLAAFFENIIPPIPGDVVVVFGAYLVGTGRVSLALAYVFVTTGSFLGFMTLFLLGYYFSDSILKSGRFKFLNSKYFKEAEKLFMKYGTKLVLANRFLSGLRSVISFISGMYKLDFKHVSLFALISCMLWNGILFFLGALIGKNQDKISNFIELYN
ncbi:DedA family protein, partial [candidate division KSB1 bacterium]